MANDATKARVAVTGAVFKGAYGAAAPTGTSGAPSAHVDLGYMNEDGVELEVPGSGEATPIKGWQNGDTVRVVRSPSEDNPTWTFVMLETKKETIETYFNVTVTQTSTEGSFEYNVTNRTPGSYVIDYVDGAELKRDYIPRGVVSDVEAITHNGTDITSYGVTVEGERDPVKAFNFKRWDTALKTSA